MLNHNRVIANSCFLFAFSLMLGTLAMVFSSFQVLPDQLKKSISSWQILCLLPTTCVPPPPPPPPPPNQAGRSGKDAGTTAATATAARKKWQNYLRRSGAATTTSAAASRQVCIKNSLSAADVDEMPRFPGCEDNGTLQQKLIVQTKTNVVDCQRNEVSRTNQKK